jgi:hypothetical protein
MKNKILISLFCFISLVCQGQTLKNYSVKGQFIYGNILKHTTHLNNLVKDPVKGAELDIEWQTMGEQPWHHYFHFPTVGIGVAGLDLGHPEMLGQLLAVYPYLQLSLINSDFLKLNIRGGAGMSLLNKRFNNTATDLNDLNTGNAAIGSVVNVYFAGGGNLEIPFGAGIAAVAGFNWNHASNGSFYQPNSGINMLNASVGLKYNPNYKQHYKPQYKEQEGLPQRFSVEIIASCGARELYYKDDKMYPTGSLVLGVFRQLGNNLRLGIAADAFYDGVYDGSSKFKRTYLTTDELKNKIRVGVSLQPELVLGKLSAGIHFGMYVYNPLKNKEPYSTAETGTLNKSLIYAYDIDDEDGWFYTRAALKYSLTEHLFLSLGLKTHLQKAEFIEWGVGCRL